MKCYWFNKLCCVPECFNSSTEGEGCFKEYFDLPAESQARLKWLTAILTEDGEDLKVCEDHFKVNLYNIESCFCLNIFLLNNHTYFHASLFDYKGK